MSFHTSLETIGDKKVIYYAVVFPQPMIEQGLLRQPHVSGAVREHMGAANANGQRLDIKAEFHSTLQFFSPPRTPAEVPGLASLLGSQVQVSVLYVASTPRIAAARLNFVRPQAVALACANACPHITLAVGSSAQAVWSNELLQVVEQKVTSATPDRVAEWRAARLVQFNNPDAGLLPIMLTGQVCAFVANQQQKHRVSPRMMSPSVSPGRATAPTEWPTKDAVEKHQDADRGAATEEDFAALSAARKKRAADAAAILPKRKESPGRPSAAVPPAVGAPSESPMRREATAEPIVK